MLVALVLALIQPEPFATKTAKDAAKELGLELSIPSEARLGMSGTPPTQEELEWILSVVADPAHSERLIRTDEIKKTLVDEEDARAFKVIEEFRKQTESFRPITDEVELVRNILNVRRENESLELNAASAYVDGLTKAVIAEHLQPVSWNQPVPPLIQEGSIKVPEKYVAAFAAIRRAAADPGLWEEERSLADRSSLYVRVGLMYFQAVTDGDMRLVINPWATSSNARVEIRRNNGAVTGGMSAHLYDGVGLDRDTEITLSDSAPKVIRWPLCDYRHASRTKEERQAWE